MFLVKPEIFVSIYAKVKAEYVTERTRVRPRVPPDKYRDRRGKLPRIVAMKKEL